jgi:hypothetical protein
MKIALHFDADHNKFSGFYSYPIYDEIFGILLKHRKLNISSKIFVGDLSFLSHSQEKVTVKVNRSTTSTKYRFNEEKYFNLINSWLFSEENNWKKFNEDELEKSLSQNIFVVCFESIDLRNAEYLFENLKNYDSFIGAIEINDSNKTHWTLYGQDLVPYAKIINKTLNLFYDNITGDYLDTEIQKEFISLGFDSVTFKDLKLKYTVFDVYHNYEHARRIAEWKKGFGSSLAHIADNIVSELSDSAPDLGNKLWSALSTYDGAETNEQFAQVVTSCRRIFEYVTDCISPPKDEPSETGHSLKSDKYKNRIFEYAKTNRASSTNIDLIIASNEVLFLQWSKLSSLANKGVHTEVFRDETRRCLIRTVLMLDDIISLKQQGF